MLETTLESSLDCKEIQPVHPKGDQSWVFTGRTDAKAETPVLWPPHAQRVDSLEKTLMLGGIGGRRRRGQQRMRWLDSITDSIDVSLNELWGLMYIITQGGLVCCNSWGRKESDTTELLN